MNDLAHDEESISQPQRPEIMSETAKRFRVALSFAGTKRDFVAQVASRLAARFSEAEILYDKYHEAEFGRANLALYLPALYHDESDLVVVVVCRDYEQKEWCGLEWRAIFDLLKRRKDSEVMLCRFDQADVEGLFSSAGFVDLDDKTADQAATRILERLALNEGKPKEHYLRQTLPVKLKRTRESIRRAADHIEACFTSEDVVADQIERACDLLLDFTKQFGVENQHRLEAISHKSDVADLLLRERRGELKPEEFRAECTKLRTHVLELTSAVADAAESHLAKVDALPATATADPNKIAAGAGLPPSDLRASLEKFLKQESGDGVAFRSQGLSKRYGIGGSYVIEQLDMELYNGEITGVVGLNGSGKTTLLRMVAGALEPTAGQRQYPGLGCKPNSWVTIRRSIAFVAQRPDRWAGTVEDALTLQAACFGDTGQRGAHLVNFYIVRLGLTDYRHHTWGQLSGGYRTRFELAKAMLSHPKMLILDEPLAALDIPAQMRFLTDLEDFATTFAKPMPVLISSQHIYEIEAIAKHMIVIRDGKAIYNGPTHSLGDGRKINGFEISCDLDVAALTSALASCGLKSIQKVGPNEFYATTDISVTANQLLDSLTQADAKVRHFRDASRSSRMFFE